MRLAFTAIAGLLLLGACNKKNDYETYTHDPMLFCNTVHELNSVVMGNNFGPVVASRNYMYASVASYEIIAAGWPDRFTSLGGQLHELGMAPKPEKGKEIDFAFAAVIAFCRVGEAVTFPEGSMKEYTDSLKRLVKDHGMPADVYDNSLAYADTVSNFIIAWSKKDHYAESRTFPKYEVKDSTGRWVPTPPAYFSALEPHWNAIRSLVVDSVNQFIPHPPYTFNMTDKNSPYYREVKMIYDTVNSLTPEQQHIADFWDDNPLKLNVSGHVMFDTKKFSPGGHWLGIAGIAAYKTNADFPTTVCGFAKTSIAMFDAFIECWNIKYIYNTLRPETAINKYIDGDWKPHLQTPPFPEYTCGHCTISAASAEALTSVYGDNISYTDSTELEFGIPSRSFSSFRDAALETKISRFYGGIHYRYCVELSHIMGKQIGDYVVSRLKMEKQKG